VVRSGDRDTAMRDWIIAPAELPGRQDPRQRGRDDDRGDEKEQRVWQSEARSFVHAADTITRGNVPLADAVWREHRLHHKFIR
jgi:hypothetical protein